MKKCPNCNLYYDDSANVCSACNGALVDANAAPQAQPAQQYEAQPAQQYEAQPAPQYEGASRHSIMRRNRHNRHSRHMTIHSSRHRLNRNINNNIISHSNNSNTISRRMLHRAMTTHQSRLQSASG